MKFFLPPSQLPSVIALDAMGSDKVAKPEIEGVCKRPAITASACYWWDPESQLRAELARYPGARRLPIEVVQASEVITMDDKVDAIRGKRDSLDPASVCAWCARDEPCAAS